MASPTSTALYPPRTQDESLVGLSHVHPPGPSKVDPGPAVSQQSSPEEAATAAEAEALEEFLVADPRGAMSPVQMVDQKVFALLWRCKSGLFNQAAGEPQNVRGVPQERNLHTTFSGTPGTDLE